MKVKELKELLNQIDENVEVLLCDNNNKDFEIDEYNVGEVTFQGACDEEGNLLPDGMDEKYDVKAFMIQFKENNTTPDFRNAEYSFEKVPTKEEIDIFIEEFNKTHFKKDIYEKMRFLEEYKQDYSVEASAYWMFQMECRSKMSDTILEILQNIKAGEAISVLNNIIQNIKSKQDNLIL